MSELLLGIGIGTGSSEPGAFRASNLERTLTRDPRHRQLCDQRYHLYQRLYAGARDVVHAPVAA